jgi:hypothetical protein
MQGDGFDAKIEAELILRDLARSRKHPEQLRAAVGMHSSIQLAIRNGFADVKHAWMKSNGPSPLFTYVNSGVIGGSRSPGMAG